MTKHAPVPAHIACAAWAIYQGCQALPDDLVETAIEKIAQMLADFQMRARHLAWSQGYAEGYDDRVKMDHDRADVIQTENPYPDLDALTP